MQRSHKLHYTKACATEVVIESKHLPFMQDYDNENERQLVVIVSALNDPSFPTVRVVNNQSCVIITITLYL